MAVSFDSGWRDTSVTGTYAASYSSRVFGSSSRVNSTTIRVSSTFQVRQNTGTFSTYAINVKFGNNTTWQQVKAYSTSSPAWGTGGVREVTFSEDFAVGTGAGSLNLTAQTDFNNNAGTRMQHHEFAVAVGYEVGYTEPLMPVMGAVTAPTSDSIIASASVANWGTDGTGVIRFRVYTVATGGDPFIELPSASGGGTTPREVTITVPNANTDYWVAAYSLTTNGWSGTSGRVRVATLPLSPISSSAPVSTYTETNGYQITASLQNANQGTASTLTLRATLGGTTVTTLNSQTWTNLQPDTEYTLTAVTRQDTTSRDSLPMTPITVRTLPQPPNLTITNVAATSVRINVTPSGASTQTVEYRYRVDNGAWSAWTPAVAGGAVHTTLPRQRVDAQGRTTNATGGSTVVSATANTLPSTLSSTSTGATSNSVSFTVAQDNLPWGNGYTTEFAARYEWDAVPEAGIAAGAVGYTPVSTTGTNTLTSIPANTLPRATSTLRVSRPSIDNLIVVSPLTITTPTLPAAPTVTSVRFYEDGGRRYVAAEWTVRPNNGTALELASQFRYLIGEDTWSEWIPAGGGDLKSASIDITDYYGVQLRITTSAGISEIVHLGTAVVRQEFTAKYTMATHDTNNFISRYRVVHRREQEILAKIPQIVKDGDQNVHPVVWDSSPIKRREDW